VVVLHRTQILIEPEQHRALTEIARREKRSLSELIRDLVQRELDQRRREEHELWDARIGIIERARERFAGRTTRSGGATPDFDAVAEIAAARAERDERALGVVAEPDR
jgi:hypothetical protein